MKISFKKALALILEGRVVALPTETVYGLAGRIDRKKTLKQIFALKKRPLFNPLIVHCRDKKQALEYMSGDGALAEKLFDFFSPGPLTVVAKKNKKIPSIATGGKATAAFRIPQHPMMRKILQALPVPLAAPSANFYGEASPSRADHVLRAFKGAVPVLDGGPCAKGLESTIIRLDSRKKSALILRAGMITKKDIEDFFRKEKLSWIVRREKDAFQPGGQKSHYRPPAPLYIIETQKREKAVREFLTKKFPGKNLRRLNLESPPEKTARLLYSRLRRLSGKKEIIFARKTKSQKGGLWEAIWDRLGKASSKRYKI